MLATAADRFLECASNPNDAILSTGPTQEAITGNDTLSNVPWDLILVCKADVDRLFLGRPVLGNGAS